MGIQPCNAKMIRRCELALGNQGIEDSYVLRVNGCGGYSFLFVTDTHRHGVWHTKTNEIEWYPADDDSQCWTSCRWTFGPHAIDRSLWGLVDGTGKWRAIEWGRGHPVPVDIGVLWSHGSPLQLSRKQAK